MKCALCDYEESDLKRFSYHVRGAHALSSREYTVQYIHGGKCPGCRMCGASTRYVAFTFKEYCKEHSHIAESMAGKRGGASSAWNKGLTKKTDKRLKDYAQRVTGQGNHFYNKKHTDEARKAISAAKRISEDEFNVRLAARAHELTCSTTFKDYSSRQQQKLSFVCNTCKSEQKKTLQAFERMSRCYVCHPISSKPQLEIIDFVKSLGVCAVENDRVTLSGKELDVLIPTHKFAIEFNGLYYHSVNEDIESDDKHYIKSKESMERGINLLHVFSDEWRDKRQIIESMIKHRLGLSKKLYARKCSLHELDASQAKAFFNESHIAGFTPSGVAHLGLMHDGMVVAAMSLRKPRQHRKYPEHVEIARFATLPNMAVVGGLGKLLAHAKSIAKQKGFKSILSYADIRHGWGKSYATIGFKNVGWTGLDYWYTDGTLRYGRFGFRARDNKSEKQVALEKGMARIFGCGSIRYVLTL